MQRKLIKGEFVERKKERFWLALAIALGALLLDAAIGTRASRRGEPRGRVLHTGATAATVLLAVCVLAVPPAQAGKSVSRGKIKAGNEAYREGNFTSAFDLYRAAIGDTTRPPKNAYGAFYNGGNALYQQKKFDRAIDYYQRSYSPDSVLTGKMLYNRGNALLKSGKAAEAVESYVQALQYMPDDEDTRHNLELAVLQKQQQQQQQQKNDKGDKKDNQQGQSQPDSSQTGEQDNKGQQQQQQKPDPNAQQDSQAQPDSSSQMPPDSSAVPLTPEEMKKLSKEDAMRILQALEDREQQLQKERRKAAFRKLKRSGKDW